MPSASGISQAVVSTRAHGSILRDGYAPERGARYRTSAALIALAAGLYLSGTCLIHAAFAYSNNPALCRAVFGWLALQPPAVTSSRASLLFLLGVLLLFVGYAIVLQRSSLAWCERRPHMSGLMLLLLALLFVSLPPFLSTDVLSYYQQGWLIAAKGTSPYVTPPGSFIPFPGIEFMKGHNYTVLSPYGPLWSHLEALVYRLTQGELWRGVALYKLLAAASLLALAAMAWAILRRAQPQMAMRGALFVGANPLLLIEGPGMAHNDVTALAVAFAGIALLLRGGEKRMVAGLALIGAALLIKALVAIVPFCLAVYWLRNLGWAHTMRLALKAMLLWVPVAVVSGFAFVGQWTDLPLLVGAVNANLPYEIKYTPVNALKDVLVKFAVDRGTPVDPSTVKLVLLALAFGAALALTLILLLRARSLLEAVKSMGPAYIAVTVAASYWRPWYAIWPVPFVALGTERRWTVVAVAYSAGALLTYAVTRTAGLHI